MLLRFFLVLLAAVYAHALVNCDFPPKCSDKLDSDGLPFSEKEIQDECQDFREFQECIDNWGKQCLSAQDLQELHAKMEKPLKFEKMICTDEKYRKDYLKEKESIEKISDEWKKCTTDLSENMMEAVKNPAEIMTAMCCATHAFDECTDDICEDKCTPEAEKIIENLINISKDAVKVDCKDINTEECPSKSSHTTYSMIVSVVTMSFLALVR
ncbi:uncharacterized protein LOC143916384 [Arctopsyche grandis]|uniref:uncharacterized protein LOC143916384 n=1 Tax=Arctopsyche grandis TaxID=121162 RepID=UPI00406D97DB